MPRTPPAMTLLGALLLGCSVSCAKRAPEPVPAAPRPTASDNLPTYSGASMPTRMGIDVAWDGSDVPPGATWAPEVEEVTVAAKLSRMPSGVAATGDRLFVAVPRWDGGVSTLHEWRDGALVAWPSQEANDAAAGPDRLHSVNAIRPDTQGRLWVLDNARIGLAAPKPHAPKIVAYDVATGDEAFRYTFPPDVATPTSFLNDLALDLDRGFVYITETGMGGPSALVVLDLQNDRSWRTLEGHPSLSADPSVEMVIDGKPATVLRNNERHPWRVGANPIALADHGDTLLFGAMTNRHLYQIATEVLRDPALSPEQREAHIAVAFDKPMSDGMDMLPDGRPVITDVENAALVVIDSSGERHKLVQSPGWFVFPVAIHAVDAQTLYFTSNQLQDMPLLHGGQDRTVPPYWVWRVRFRGGP